MAATSAATVELSFIEFTASESNTHATDDSTVPVVFLHGLLGNKKNFASLARSLARQLQRQRRIFGLDMRNHGDNDNPMADMTYPQMAADVVAWMDAQKMPQAVLVGHSMGGKVAQAVALLHPDRVDGLVILDMAPVQYSEATDATWEAVCNIVRCLQQVPSHDDGSTTESGLTKRKIDAALRNDIPDPALRAFCLTNWDDKMGRWKIPMDIIAGQLPTLAAFDVVSIDSSNSNNATDGLSYQGDAFFIHGGQSRFVRHSHLPTIQQYFPNHMLTTIRGSGHWVHAEAPEDTLSLLLQFLDR